MSMTGSLISLAWLGHSQEMTPSFLAANTDAQQTTLWIDKRRNVMEKWWPETTN